MLKRLFRNGNHKKQFFQKYNPIIACLTILLNIVQLCFIAHSLASFYFHHPPKSSLNFVRVVGLILFVTSFFAWSIAKFQLGASFSLLPAVPHALVTNGIYARFKDPIYFFSALSLVGYFIFIDKPRSLFFLLFFLPLQWLRSKQESALLKDKFGEEYELYLKQVWI